MVCNFFSVLTCCTTSPHTSFVQILPITTSSSGQYVKLIGAEYTTHIKLNKKESGCLRECRVFEKMADLSCVHVIVQCVTVHMSSQKNRFFLQNCKSISVSTCRKIHSRTNFLTHECRKQAIADSQKSRCFFGDFRWDGGGKDRWRCLASSGSFFSCCCWKNVGRRIQW